MLSDAEYQILMAESSGNPKAKNPRSGARHIWQCLNSVCEKYYGQLKLNPDTTDIVEQIAAFRLYVEQRYGNAERALAFRQQQGWY